MPVASSWVRPNGSGDTTVASSKPSADTAAPEIAPGPKQHSKQPVRKKPAKAGVWTPALAAERAAKAAKEAAEHKSKREAEAAEKAATEAAAKAKEAELQAELAKLKQEKEALRAKRERAEAARQQQAEATLRNEQQAAAQRREAGAALANGMQTSEKLKRKRTEYEAQHKEEIARRAREAETRRRLEANIIEQSQLIAHIMARHTTFYDLLQIPEGSSADVVKRARKNLSFRVHPDRCKHDNAKDAFHRINQAADALLQNK